MANSYPANSDNSNIYSDPTEFILIPDKDVIEIDPDHSNYSNQSIVNTNIDPHVSVSPMPRPVSPTVDFQPAPSHKNQVAPTSQYKSANSSIWFIMSFLMTVVILGGAFFYFYVEDQRIQIAGLERQLSGKADSRIQGVIDNKIITENSGTLTAVGENLTIFPNEKFADKFGFSESKTDIPYFENAPGLLSTYLSDQAVNGRNYKDGLEIYSTEKDEKYTVDSILNNIQKEDDGFISSGRAITTKNNIDLELFSSKDNTKLQYLVGVTDSFTYVVLLHNQSNSISGQNEFNSYVANMVGDLNLN